MKVNRLKELERLAEKLGIGQDREVECVSCHKKLRFPDAIILTDNQKVSYLCGDCNEKLTKGKLNENSDDDLLKRIKELEQRTGVVTVPWQPMYPSEPATNLPGTHIEDVKWTVGDYKTDMSLTSNICNYKIYSVVTKPNNMTLLKFEPR